MFIADKVIENADFSNWRTTPDFLTPAFKRENPNARVTSVEAGRLTRSNGSSMKSHRVTVENASWGGEGSTLVFVLTTSGWHYKVL